jgi:hypothetical protein
MQNVHFMFYDPKPSPRAGIMRHYQNKWLKMMRQHSQNVRPNLVIIFSQVAYFDNVLTLGLYLALVDFWLGVECPIQWHFEGPSSLEKVHDNFNC